MTRSHRAALGVALMAALGSSGCTDFLTGEGIDRDPNFPTQATRDQLFVAVQAAQFGQQLGSGAFLSCMYMQQCSGVGGRFVETWDNYGALPQDLNADFIQAYTGGGLVDLRQIRAGAEAAGDRQYEGIAKIWEALAVSFLADNWGDIPYREAAGGSSVPVFDPQLQVYADLQELLDEAIDDLGGAGPGPGAVDLVHRGDATKWREAAYTLKARLHMHTAEVLGNTAYTVAVAAATNGISAPANDFRTLHTTATSERNMWNQFNGTSFGGDIVAGKRLVDLMVARDDPRLPEYFGLNPSGGYGGNDVNGATPTNEISLLEGARNSPTFRQPLLTWEENQLILAEARYQLAGGGAAGTAAAQPHLDAVRSQYIATPIVATLENIMTEKYIALFQNVEVWQDYKRTCLPPLAPAAGAAVVPGRVYYGTTEANANPNTPPVSSQLANGGVAGGRPGVGGFRNPNDPAACPAP
ncbi:MAG TPA: SusD/RagB family nutrient-binding outer membrane lipoprotein [Gemmatimonadaceae bacterium]|nr:SusD/RagB family nutrient-binding outer membrane lipoprotein [Gemmatimonadaceae bacterium]